MLDTCTNRYLTTVYTDCCIFDWAKSNTLLQSFTFKYSCTSPYDKQGLFNNIYSSAFSFVENPTALHSYFLESKDLIDISPKSSLYLLQLTFSKVLVFTQ